jgi:predicted nuclease of predicted toxin-antitoxin system
VKLLVDQNLPRSLATHFSGEFPPSIHVASAGLDHSTDEVIWAHALDNGFAIITKDSDYQQMSFLRGHPPKVIWLAGGNCSVDEIKTLLTKNLESIRGLETDENISLLFIQ